MTAIPCSIKSRSAELHFDAGLSLDATRNMLIKNDFYSKLSIEFR